MKLAAFINAHVEEIVEEFVAFASTLEPASLGNSVAELRDHARGILLTIAADLSLRESAKQLHDKAVGDLPPTNGPESAAAAHGAARQSGGFTLPQLTAEYRALRASVLRLWLPMLKSVTKTTAADIARFHEGIDQALQESAIQFALKTDRARDTFLAILGHDLRNPLTTMTMAGNFLTRKGEGSERTLQIGLRVKRSAAAMTIMVNDLLAFARTELGGKMPITRSLGDLRDICQDALDEAATAHPDCVFQLVCAGDTIGDFDGPRLSQVFSNLLNNAAQYRGDARPVELDVTEHGTGYTVTVTNHGQPIAASSLRSIFDPMVQLAVAGAQKGPAPTSIGLGLFIAREITLAHGGTINVQSDAADGTVFTILLPRSVEPRG